MTVVIKVINLNGQVIYNDYFDSMGGNGIIDLSNEPKGVYYVIIRGYDINGFEKIIIN